MKTKILLIFFLIFIACKKKNSDLLLQNLIYGETIQYFFSHPYDSINNEKIKQEIIQIIKNTKYNLYIFCYGLDEEDIIFAIKEIYDKGVYVKIVGSSDQNYDLLIHNHIPYELKQNSGLQHIKMILSDHTLLFAGTGNFTKSDIFYNSNLYFKIKIPEEKGKLIIKKFYYLDYINPITINHSLYKIKILQSPENGKEIQSIINNTILNAQKNISFYIYSFYDPTIMNSLYFKSLKGIPLYGIIDKSNINENNDNLFLLLNNQLNNLNLYKDNFEFYYVDSYGINRGGKLHHKSLIIDDKLLTGSYNFSLSARDNNSEIFFFIEDPINISYIKYKYHSLFGFSSLIHSSKQSISNINDSYINTKFCQLTEGNNIYFQGKNAFFFMEYITKNNCANRNSYSSGIVNNPTDGFFYSKGFSIKNLSVLKEFNNNDIVFHCESLCDPCEYYNCEFFTINNINLNSNYFVLNNDLPIYIKYYLWNGKEILKLTINSKIEIDHKYYYFFTIYDFNNEIYTSSISDGILFILYNENLLMSCFYTNEIRNNLRIFLNLLEWYNEKFLYLYQQCLKIAP